MPKKSTKKKEVVVRKCSCGKIAIRQTVRGQQNQERGGLPQNDGWYCDKCWKEGEELENEAMYGR